MFLSGCSHNASLWNNSFTPKEDLSSLHIIEKIHFEPKKTEYTLADVQKIEKVVSILVQNPNADCWILSSSDHQGSREYNYQLSYKRSLIIAQAVCKKGIEENRLHLVPLGKEGSFHFCNFSALAHELRASLLIVADSDKMTMLSLSQLSDKYNGTGLITGAYKE